jgi:hypothetical protein
MANTTWNPADLAATTLSGGNLITTPTGASGVRSIYSASAGKYYFEISFSATGVPSSAAVGIANSSASLTGAVFSGTSVADCNGSGSVQVNGTGQTGVGNIANSGTCCIALDMGGKLVWFRNGAAGNWNGSGTANPATGVGGYSVSGLTGGATALYAFACATGASASGSVANFGDSAFIGVAPAGFAAGFPGTVASTAQARAMVLA